MASSDDAQPDSTSRNPQFATRSVLAVHVAVKYSHAVGLGVGLVSRAACAKTAKARQKVLKTQKQGFKFHGDKFNASRKRPGKRAALLGISEALALAKKTILTRWTTTPTNVAILLGRPWCDGTVVKTIRYHVEQPKSSLKQMPISNCCTMAKIIRRIHKIRSCGFKMAIAVSDCDGKNKKAPKKFKRLCLEHQRYVAGSKERGLAEEMERRDAQAMQGDQTGLGDAGCMAYAPYWVEGTRKDMVDQLGDCRLYV